ncbi:MAG TPA: hypothetical protein VGF06_13960 [Terriglobales bacterium]
MICALWLAALFAQAQQGRVTQENGGWTQEVSGSLSGVRNLHIRVEAGAVHVQGAQQSDVNYTYRAHVSASSEEKARRQFEGYKINSYVRGDTGYLVADWEGGGHRRDYGDFNITVPRGIDLVKIETGGGGVSVKGISGRVESETGGGKVHLEDIGGSVNAQTGGDAIEAASIGGELNVETGGGKLYLGPVKGHITASTGGGEIVLLSSEQGAILDTGAGDIQVRQCGGQLKVTTGGGNIDVGDISGPGEFETGGGSIRVASSKALVRAETGSGRIELNGVPAVHAETGAGGIVARFISVNHERADSVLETSTGDVIVYLPVNISITVRAAIDVANGHKIHSEFSEIPVRVEDVDWPQTITAEGSLNGGGPLLKVRTTTGDIWFRRANQ